jgi:hypothetical protein
MPLKTPSAVYRSFHFFKLQIRIRDRSLIMARQMFAEQGSQFADEQVGALLSSLNIDPAALPQTVGQSGWEGIYAAGAHPLAPEHAAGQAMVRGGGALRWGFDRVARSDAMRWFLAAGGCVQGAGLRRVFPSARHSSRTVPRSPVLF